MNINDKIKKQINENIDLKYLSFHSSLVPNISTIQGVRVPVLRKIAKSLSKEKDILKYLEKPTLENYEEVTIYGLAIGYLKLDIEKYRYYLDRVIPYIDNWATCDIVASNLKFIKKSKQEMYSFILKYLNSKKEFEVRFAIVLLMDYYLDEEFMDTLKLVEKVKLDYYYVKMAISWLISICYIKHKDETIEFLKNTSLDNWTYNKVIQKIIESNRVTKQEKEYFKTLKR